MCNNIHMLRNRFKDESTDEKTDIFRGISVNKLAEYQYIFWFTGKFSGIIITHQTKSQL